MTQMKMTFKQFESLVVSYGGQSERWPVDLRKAALQFMGENAKAKEIAGQAMKIDRFLDAVPVPEAASDAFLERLHRISSEQTNTVPSKSKRQNVIQTLLDLAGLSMPRPATLIPQAASLFVAGLVGIMLGLSTFGIPASAERADAYAYMFGNPSLETELLELD